MKNLKSIQEWLPFSKIFNKGVVKLKDESYVKILKIIPINYSLKSEIEKEAILNSYKIFLKTCNFNIQILIQSNKEDLNQIISKINNQIKNEKEEKIKKISNNYINYIKEINYNRKSTARRFFIIIKINNKKGEENIKQELEENFLKIKENLERCGNRVEEIETKEETREILFSFYNKRLSQM
ncbi:MAG: hypothetical protein HFJ43_00300 [Clostridia bacterium]|nr:hypothetical protein [Clostridia bacterium]